MNVSTSFPLAKGTNVNFSHRADNKGALVAGAVAYGVYKKGSEIKRKWDAMFNFYKQKFKENKLVSDYSFPPKIEKKYGMLVYVGGERKGKIYDLVKEDENGNFYLADDQL